MKKTSVLAAILLLILVSGFSFPDFAVKKTYTWQDKLKRGALNIVSSPVEIAREIHVTSVEKSLLNGWTIGLLKGVGNGLLRFGTGAIDVITCPFNFPDSQKAPLIDPEYVWQKPGPRYN